jgi:hypothetical protein
MRVPLCVVVQIILIIGFFLLLFGANPSAGFTQWAYRNLDRVMEPFRGIFTPIQLGTTSGNVEAVFDCSVRDDRLRHHRDGPEYVDQVAIPAVAVSRRRRS